MWSDQTARASTTRTTASAPPGRSSPGITLYIEGVKDARKFLAAVKKCEKPIVIFKAGRTERGRKAAESHTRSLAGKDEIYDAAFRQFGIHRAASLEELYDFSKALAYVPAPAGPRMLIVTSSGGSAIIATDIAEENGFRVTPLPAPLASRLREILPPHCIVGNPLDLTGDTDAERYRKVLAASRDDYDVVMTIFGDPISGASLILDPGGPSSWRTSAAPKSKEPRGFSSTRRRSRSSPHRSEPSRRCPATRDSPAISSPEPRRLLR